MIALLKSIGARLARTYPGRLAQAYLASQAGNYAAGLAFTAFLSMFPLILGLLAILGLATSAPDARAHFLSATLTFLPTDSRSTISSALDGIRRNSGILGVIGIVGLLWSGSSLFSSLEWSLGRMIGSRQRDFLRQKGMALVMTLVFVLAVVASIFLNSAVAIFDGVPLVGQLAGLLVWLAFMAAVYRLVPNRTHPLRRLWPGVLIAGALMEVLTLVWPLYSSLAHDFNTYGSAFALFFVLAAWLYFFAQFMLLGAVANRMHAGGPTARGLISTPKAAPLETEATRAADQHGAGRRAA
jgi:membrane protein